MEIDCLPPGFAWNQFELVEGAPNELHAGLLMLIAFEEKGTPHLIGTAFILEFFDDKAIAMTAAHNLSGAARAQVPVSRRHPTALDEFIPGFEQVQIDPKRLQAIHQNGEKFSSSKINWAVWDVKADMAVISVTLINENDLKFEKMLPVSDCLPPIGSIVGVMGYAQMRVASFSLGETWLENFNLERKFTFRVGTVVAHHMDGHWLCRGPCIETSIPVFGGMSGGPGFVFSETDPIKPIGLISSDRGADEDPSKNDRSIAGSTIIALLPITLTELGNGNQGVKFSLNKAFGTGF